jgi:hypothetical protein
VRLPELSGSTAWVRQLPVAGKFLRKGIILYAQKALDSRSTLEECLSLNDQHSSSAGKFFELLTLKCDHARDAIVEVPISDKKHF